MKIHNILLLGVVISVFFLSGCVARTYQMTRDRIDQNLTGGNRGYISGTAPNEQEVRERKPTKTTQVVEIELGLPKKFLKKSRRAAVKPQEYPFPETAAVSEAEKIVISSPAENNSSPSFQKYTVEKNDTLQKISQKLYGTTKKWPKIYEANKDVLKGPNKLYPGQVLNVPVYEETAQKQPEENLK